ncbi:hypothetical protein D9M70_594850 [compost metagenome]
MVERLDGQAIRILAADELAIVLDQALGTGMGAARRDRQRHATEREDLESEARIVLDDAAHRRHRQFWRQTDARRAPRCQ